MPHAYVDVHWPIVLSRAWGESTDEDMASYLAMADKMLARRERHVLIVDATEGKLLKSSHRKQLADWTKRHEGELRRYRAGLALVTSSAVVRGMITAVYWLAPPPFPYHPVATLEEAWSWARERIAEDGAPPPEAPRSTRG